MLSPYRVVDLSDERGHLCGYILAALGAEVLAVEPPDGSRARRLPPFIDDIEDIERSLTHFAYNRGKKSVTLDVSQPEDRDRLRTLIGTSDLVISSNRPGELAEFGLGHEQLRADFPGLICVDITAFGQTGPKSGWAAADLTVMASAATLSVTGDADRPPVRLTVPQGFHFGAASAASGAILALLERSASGEGQHVDAAAQRTATLGTQAGLLSTGVGSVDSRRSAGGAVTGNIRLRLVYPAADGYVSITHVFGMPIGQNTARLMAWVHEEGFCDAALRDKDWIGYLDLLESGAEPIEEWEKAKAAVAAFTSSKSKRELLEGAMERGLLMAPISTPADVLASEQFEARSFFETVEHPTTGRKLRVPGAFAKCSATPLEPLGP
ncbi:MAG: CaiB/BaiF CoA transferase family protein, partial [Acidimicrobiales bacterium]